MKSTLKTTSIFPGYACLQLILICTLFTGCAAQLKYMDGWDHLQAGDYTTGLNELQAAMAEDPDNTRYRVDWLTKRDEVTNILLVRAAKAALAQNTDSAEQIYKTILAYDDTNVRAKAGLETLQFQIKANQQAQAASVALKQGNLQSALTLANAALSISPDNMEAKAVKRQISEAEARDMLNAPSLSNLYKKPITLEFRDTSLKMVFELLSRTTGINFILDRDVKTDQRTTIFLKKASLEDALNMLAATNQLDKKVLNSSSVLIYPNTSSKNKEYQDLIVRAFYLHSADAKTTSEMIKSILKLKDVFVDEKFNMLVVRDSPEAIGLVDKLISLYDLPEPEVMLDVEVLEIDRTLALNMGIQITDQLTITPLSALNTGVSVGTTANSSSQTNPQSLSSIFPLNKSNVGFTSLPTMTITADQQNGDANLLANPRIRVRSHDKAKILIGNKIPLITTTTGNTGFVSENIQYLDVGLKLNVEPVIYPGDEVVIKLNLEVSSLGQQVQTKSGSIAYQIGTRSADTVLRLVDGETQILAGLLNNEERSSADGLPGLTSLPIIGRLFSNQQNSHNKTEIVLSITPHLIRGVQRKDPAAEMFWSGTDATLSNKPLQLRIQDEATPGTGNGTTGAKMANVTPDVKVDPSILAAVNSPLKLNWNGPTQLQVGQEAQFDLMIDTNIVMRSLPMQIAYDPKKLEVTAVEDGGYFNRDGNQGNLSQTVDKNGGRIAIALGGNIDASGVAGKLLSLKVKALVPGEASLDLTGITPMGAKQSFAKPTLPIQHNLILQNQ